MARLNLLPWREARRQRLKRLFVSYGVAALVFTLGAAIASYLVIEDLVLVQESRNAFLTAEIFTLDRKIKEIKEIEKKKADLLARMDIIQELQQIRPEVVHLLDEIVTAIPDGVFLTGIKQSGRNVILEGRAQSYGRISDLMRNIKASAWITNPTLNIIKDQDKSDRGLSQFELQFQQQRPPAPKPEEDKAPA
ncbi:MAG: PilN domain-containing protein [Chromatiaceae bacterium]|jgi:type IV pilus assembly protein PilN|nr:PilN domain-containing protein [Chromatiaceae bacterium]MBP6806763.1 PilN domain-containing protein [Chromatiaceae bacterium]MBP8197569.1 PilN domain-containing protein [Chromatiaceae bacterium]MBP8283637.1 PilN domain-containing protein [Chromatiaceae bacterium]